MSRAASQPDSGVQMLAPRAQGLQHNLVEALGLAIVSGAHDVGEPLSEVALLARYGVSRTTLREALRVLASKGLIESRQKVGTSVRRRDHWNWLDPDVLSWLSASPADAALARELVAFRRMIEPQVAGLAASAVAAGGTAGALSAAYATMVAAHDDRISYYVADRAFHAALFAAAENRFVAALGRSVLVVLELSFALQSQSLINPARGLVLHGDVLRAVEAGDPAAARQAMLALLDEAAQELSRSRQPRGPNARRSGKRR